MNTSKSELFARMFPYQDLATTQQAIGSKIGFLAVRYLGVPLTKGRLTEKIVTA